MSIPPESNATREALAASSPPAKAQPLPKDECDLVSQVQMLVKFASKAAKVREQERAFQTMVDATVVQVISVAFQIYVAFMVQKFFEVMAGYVMFGDDKRSKQEVFWLRVIWFTITMIVYPLSETYFESDTSGSRRRTFLEDIKELWRASVGWMVKWSFKDVGNSTLGLLNNWFVPETDGWHYPGSVKNYWFNDYSSRNVEACLWYALAILTALIILTAFAVTSLVLLQIFSDKTTGKISQYIKKLYLAAPPFLLGVGLIEAEIASWPWYWFPISWVGSGTNFGMYGAAVRFVTSCFSTWSITIALSWHANHVRRRGASISGFYVDVLLKSLPFAFAVCGSLLAALWLMYCPFGQVQWSQFTYEVFFNIPFNCGWPFGKTVDLRLWIAYCVVNSLMAIYLIPVVKADGQLLRSLDKVYAYSLLQQDKQMMRGQATSNELFASLFSIGVGWGYSKTAQAECLANYTPTCPNDIDTKSFFQYFITVVFYILVASLFYHQFMTSFRFKGRANKVQFIKDGRADELFKEIDVDKSGTVSKAELDAFLQKSGLDGEIFDTAFKTFESEDVDSNDLVKEFNAEMKRKRELILKRHEQGDDKPPEKQYTSQLQQPEVVYCHTNELKGGNDFGKDVEVGKDDASVPGCTKEEADDEKGNIVGQSTMTGGINQPSRPPLLDLTRALKNDGQVVEMKPQQQIDDDTKPDPKWLETHRRFLERLHTPRSPRKHASTAATAEALDHAIKM